MSDILGFTGPYRFLSNFYPAKVVYEDEVYSTVEHAYQAAKTLDEDIRAKIRMCATPGQTKRIGKTLVIRPDWDELRVEVMWNLLNQKFSQTELANRLLSTGSSYIEETNHWGDVFWGVCNGHGKNMLGQMLMKIRTNLLTL